MAKKMTEEKKNSVKNSVGRLVFAGLSIIFQFAWIYLIIFRLDANLEWISIAIRILAFILVLFIYGKSTNSSMKMPWIIVILVMPVFGVMLYLLVGLSGTTKWMRDRYRKIDRRLFRHLENDTGLIEKLSAESPRAGGISRYINSGSMPLFQNTDVKFFGNTTEAIENQKQDMLNAKSFIFMEYHGIEDTIAFHEIEEILKKKVSEGVEVRIFYDDIGSIGYVNKDFIRRLTGEGIKCRVFNPVTPFINIFLNNRDHRKITVIDNEIGYTGGYNIADEYFNITHPYGHWKDSGIRLEGDAVSTLTMLYLEMWNAIKVSETKDSAFDRYFTKYAYKAEEKGFVQPYCDNPMIHEPIGENVYINIISTAERYVYITTPYLIITDEMSRTLELAAKRGVDVRIITPGIPDKKFVFRITRSYYANLIRSGVRIYEYTPGFMHAKQFVSDDCIATCGTINLDYRSLYHHFENGVFMYGCEAVHEIKRDFLDTLPQCSEVVSGKYVRKSGSLRISKCLLRLISPLM